MSPADVTPESVSETLPAGLAVAGVYSSASEAFQHSLVILAMGEACWLEEGGDVHRLLVEEHVLEVARVQLAKFDRESIGWPPVTPVDTPALPRVELLTPLLWSAAVLAIFRLQQLHPDWTDAGALDPDAIFVRGEWWRAITALFLHGDAAHVVSNALSGILAFAALVTTLGRRRGWLLLAISACLGNIAVAAANFGHAYRSLGASTAIFAAIGVLSGRAVRFVARSEHPQRWRAMFVPAATGLIVLGLYGAGGANVDVPAHLAGFVAGVVIGFLAGLGRARYP
jgi:membrane associated rhomboid family serine protease